MPEEASIEAKTEGVPRRRRRKRHSSQLRPVGVRPSLYSYTRQLWNRRHFIKMQANANAMGGHRGTFLGNLWLIVAPILDGLVYFLIFGVLFSGHREIPNFFGYLIIGVFMFSFTSRTVTAATKCVTNDKGLIRAFSFPRAALPVAAVWREAISVLPVIYVLVILLLVVPPKGTLGLTWLVIPGIFLMHLIFNLGLGFIFARLGAQIPDLQYLVPYAMRLLLYTSAVLFSIDRFDAHPPLGEIARNNPLYILLDMYRSVFLNDQLPTAESWIKIAIWAGATLLVGFVFFWRAEVKYARASLD